MIESLKVEGDRPQGWVAWARIAPWGVAALAVAAIAAASTPAVATGKLPGFIAGAILIALVGYAFIDYLRPLTDDPDSGLIPALLVLAALAVLKLVVMPYFPGFGPDVGDYQAWASQIATFGPAHTYQQGFFLDYPPGYLYGLWVVGILAHAIGATGNFYRVIIESPAIVADLALALLVYAFMRRGSRPEMAFIAMLMVALNPPLVFDTVVWGQSDSVMTFVTLLSIVSLIGEQYEIAWGLAAIAVLVKPQGLMMLPVLGFWTMLETDFATWIRSGIALIAVAIIGIAPFQIGHEWNWIIKLYSSTAAYYHETSVNAFNLMALLGGVRQADSNTLAGVSYFALGMSLLVPLYAFVAWILWRGRTPTRLLFASFIAIFGFFMVAPRMHERYLYPAIALAVPLALEAPEMLAVFAILTITCFINLAYILHTLNTVVFLDSRDGLAMATSALNVVALGLALYWGATRMKDSSAEADPIGAFFTKFAMPPRQIEDYVEEPASALPWIATDTIIISVLLIAAVVTRFWNLSHPAEIVFDEVHFVAQGRHYLHGESFLDPHPPLAKLVIALGILLFGDHPFGWRVGNATIGTALVGITYLLGRRMSGSRLVGALAGAIILCDGMYLVDSHYAVIDIVYLTLAAIAYLLFFKFVQTPDQKARQRVLPWIGLALGLCLASKLYVPGITFLLVVGFIVYVIARDRPKPAPPEPAVEIKAPIEAKPKKIKVPAPVPVAAVLIRSNFSALYFCDLYRAWSRALSERRSNLIRRSGHSRVSGCPLRGDLLAEPLVDINRAIVADAVDGRSPRTEESWRRPARRICGHDHVPRSVHPAFLARMVGRHLRSGQVLHRRGLVRAERFVGDASVFFALVELAADAAPDRLLAELSQDGRRADGLGRRQSGAMVGRADRDHDHRRAGDRAPEPHAIVPGHRLSQLPVNLGVDRPHAVLVPLHGVGLFRIPRAGDSARRMFQGTRRALGASRAIADDDAGVFSRAASDVGVDHLHCSGRRVRLCAVEDSVCRSIRRQCVRDHRTGSVRLLLPDLGRPTDQPRRILRANVAPIRRNT